MPGCAKMVCTRAATICWTDLGTRNRRLRMKLEAGPGPGSASSPSTGPASRSTPRSQNGLVGCSHPVRKSPSCTTPLPPALQCGLGSTYPRAVTCSRSSHAPGLRITPDFACSRTPHIQDVACSWTSHAHGPRLLTSLTCTRASPADEPHTRTGLACARASRLASLACLQASRGASRQFRCIDGRGPPASPPYWPVRWPHRRRPPRPSSCTSSDGPSPAPVRRPSEARGFPRAQRRSHPP